MCGIIAVVPRRSARSVLTSDEIVTQLDPLGAQLGDVVANGLADLATVRATVTDAAQSANQVNDLLRGVPGARLLLSEATLMAAIDTACDKAIHAIAAIEKEIDASNEPWPASDAESVNAVLIATRDALWGIQRDRLRAARAVADLAGAAPDDAAISGFLAIHQALSGIDRLEVRGRDSAGIHVMVRNPAFDVASPAVREAIAQRSTDQLFTSGAVQVADGSIGFVYKAAAEIGELGDNTQAIRDAIRADGLLTQALRGDAEVVVLGHTRWASVGIVSEANAHPLNSSELSEDEGPYVLAALNGDIDNFADLKAHQGLAIAQEITTDAKVIPTIVSRALRTGGGLVDGFRASVNSFEGSVAIAANVAGEADRLLLALRGSGQALYVGLGQDQYIVASEPYGIVEDAVEYIRLDGETPSNPDNPTASRGQVMELRADAAGELSGISRWSYDGTELPVTQDDVAIAEITTRDIDRGPYQHYLLKEISESPQSFRKTLRGKLVERDGALRVALGPDTLPDDLREKLRAGKIRRVFAIGQGTAAVATQSFSRALHEIVNELDVWVESVLATELSGFGMREDMSDTLIVAISQSGTTTDTNRTVDLVRSRGAAVIAIVNRRGSDLTDKSDGVLYTSDGRDVEMSVASTKAFYSQIAAGFLLAYAIAEDLLSQESARGTVANSPEAFAERSDVLMKLRAMPEAMEATLERRSSIAAAAQQLAPAKRYWAIVGSGADRVAAQEIRVKLSELCYKSIACDSIEDKKHIDLSSEPLILVCATSLVGSNADDVAKEVAIYRAHKATPIVIATEGEERFSAALQVLTVPATHPRLGFVLATVVGHLFGYEAALAIDALAMPLREARAVLDGLMSESVQGDDLMSPLPQALEPMYNRWATSMRAGSYDGHLEASTATRISTLFRYAIGNASLDMYQADMGRQGSPGVLIEDFSAALSSGIEELTRPVDAIKHQAKTVTVGISRSDEGVLQVPLVKEVLAAGASRDRLSYRALQTIARLEPAVAEVLGYTRYRIEGRIDQGNATIVVVDRGGISRDLPLRTETNPLLRGTKHRVAFEREVTVAVGRSDGRTVLLVPEIKGNQCTGITLLHVRFEKFLPSSVMRSVLEGYRNRYEALRDAVTETEPDLRQDLLETIPVVDLLTDPVLVMAAKWKSHP